MPRVKQHFKSHLSLANHAKTAAVWSENDLLATWLRLGHLAVERRAGKTADVFLVGDQELQVLTGKGRVDVARKLLGHLADIAGISARRHGNIWVIEWPNFSEKQGFGPKNGSPPTTYYQLQKEVPKEPPVDPSDPGKEADGGNPPDSRGSSQTNDPAPAPRDTRPESVRRLWPACAQAAAGYGKRWTPKPSPRRVTMMAARLRDFPSADPDVLVRAIHGAVRSWNRDEEAIAKWLRPETVYRRSNFEKYVEAYNEPPPPNPTPRRTDIGRDNTVRGAVERLAQRYDTERDEGQVVDVRSFDQRVPDE